MFSSSDYELALENCLVLSVAQTVAAPLERAKIVMQCEFALQRAQVIRGLEFHTFRQTIARLYHVEGAAQMWRGNLANVMRAVPASLVVYTRTGELPLPLFSSGSFRRRRDGLPLWILSTWARSAASAAFFLALCWPLEFARTALAADCKGRVPNPRYLHVGTRAFHGYAAVLRHAAARGAPGGWGLYAGFAPAVAALAVYRFVHIVADLLSRTLFGGAVDAGSDANHPPLRVELARSFGVSLLAGMAAYPLDTLSRWAICEVALTKFSEKQQQQFARLDPEHRRAAMAATLSSPSKLFRQAYQIGGHRIFFSGAGVNVLRNAAVMGSLHFIVSRY